MGSKSLESMTGLAPEPLEDNAPDHGDTGSNADDSNIDKLFSEAFDEDDEDEELPETPAKQGKTKKAEGDEDDKEDTDDPDDADSPDDDDPDSDDDPDKPDDEVVPDEDPDEVPDVAPEVMAQVQSSYKQALQDTETSLVRRAKPVVDQLNTRQATLTSRLQAIKASTSEDGVEVPLSFDQQLEVQSIVNELQTISGNKNQLEKTLRQQLKADQDEVTIQHNMRLYPVFQKYEKEYRKLFTSGMDCSDADLVYTVCRQLRARDGGGGQSTTASSPQRPAAKPPISKQQIEQAALTQTLERKKRGTVTSGAKGAGASNKATRSLPEHAKKELAQITKYFNGEDEDE